MMPSPLVAEKLVDVGRRHFKLVILDVAGDLHWTAYERTPLGEWHSAYPRHDLPLPSELNHLGYDFLAARKHDLLV